MTFDSTRVLDIFTHRAKTHGSKTSQTDQTEYNSSPVPSQNRVDDVRPVLSAVIILH